MTTSKSTYKASREALFGVTPTPPESKIFECQRCKRHVETNKEIVETMKATLLAPQPGEDVLEEKRSVEELERITREMGIYLQKNAKTLAQDVSEKTLVEVVNTFLSKYKVAPGNPDTIEDLS